MAASCFSMATAHKLPSSLESLAAAGGGGLTVSSCVKGQPSFRVAMMTKPRTTVAVSHALRGLSCFIPVMNRKSRRFLRTATAWSEGPLSTEVIDDEEAKGFESEELSEGEVLESEETGVGIEAVLQGDTEQGSEREGSYEQTDFPIPDGTKLYVGNIPFDITSEELARIFEESGVVEMVEVIYDKATERSRGFAFVTMSTVEEAEGAIQKFNGSEVGGRPLRVNFPEVPRGSRRIPSPRSYTSNFVDSPHKVYVGNIPFSTTSDTLRSAFERIGNVLDARVVFNRETGRSRGFGFVTFSSGADVDAAVSSMDGVDLEGRTIRVNVALPRSTQTEG